MSLRFSFVVLMCFSLALDAAEPLVIHHPTMASGKYDHYDLYYLDIIRLISQKSSVPIVLKARNLPEIPQDRATILIKQGRIDIFWMVTNLERERELLPIRIPLYRGLIGWRIMIVHADNQDLFTRLADTSEIRRLRAIQGHDWPDSDILEANGYNLARSSIRRGLFETIYHKRVDYFPRSIIEIHTELAKRPKMSLAVEPSVVFRYPTATYFFVKKENIGLARVLEEGFDKIIADGSFNKLFMRYYGEAIKKSKLDKRKMIYLDNPLLPPETPLHRKALWFDIGELKP